MTRNNPRNQRSCTAKQIGGLSRAKRHGPPIALSVYKNVLVSGDDDRGQYFIKIELFYSTFKAKVTNIFRKIVTLQDIY